jgi:heterodisulfide reductase subunit A-like polyferredoxin
MEKHVQRAKMNINQRPKAPLPTRAEQLKSLREEQFDVFVIGGGATGTGCALDAATRGLKTALVKVLMKVKGLHFYAGWAKYGPRAKSGTTRLSVRPAGVVF